MGEGARRKPGPGAGEEGVNSSVPLREAARCGQGWPQRRTKGPARGRCFGDLKFWSQEGVGSGRREARRARALASRGVGGQRRARSGQPGSGRLPGAWRSRAKPGSRRWREGHLAVPKASRSRQGDNITARRRPCGRSGGRAAGGRALTSLGRKPAPGSACAGCVRPRAAAAVSRQPSAALPRSGPRGRPRMGAGLGACGSPLGEEQGRNGTPRRRPRSPR